MPGGCFAVNEEGTQQVQQLQARLQAAEVAAVDANEATKEVEAQASQRLEVS